MSINEISPREWYSVNRYVLEIKEASSPCVSAYIPSNKVSEIVDIIHHTRRSENIEKIESVIEDKIRSLIGKEVFAASDATASTYCIFGWNGDQGIKIKEITVSKEMPPVYAVDKRPYLKPLHDLLKIDYEVLLIIMDHKSAILKQFRGSRLVQESKLGTYLKNKHSKGGSSQARFARNREIQIDQFLKKINVKIKDFDLRRTDIILLGGPGLAKKEFLSSLDPELAKKTSLVENITFSTSPSDLAEKIISRLYQYRRDYAVSLTDKFDRLVKEGLTETEISAIHQALSLGAVDTLIVSANYYSTSVSEHEEIMKMIEIAENTSTKIEFISNPALLAKLDLDDRVLAILRYKLK
ncbi:MAG: Vms1/Ankzf1 family peptidyl-tRNA hydrolase [Nitrosotalea sp.]